MFSKILVPVDGSKHSEKAISIATQLQKVHDADLLLLNVYRHHSLREQSLSMVRPSEPNNIDSSLKDYAKEVVNWAKESAEKQGAEGVQTVVRAGQPARTIVDTAKDNNADLIVLGSRGLGDLQGFLLGSVSHKVTSLSRIPVLVV